MREQSSLAKRLRSEIVRANSRSWDSTDHPQHVKSESTTDNSFPCPPTLLKPLLYFYKFLQPLPNGRKLQVNLPTTVLWSKKDNKEELLWLSTDADGFVIKQEKPTSWRRVLFEELVATQTHGRHERTHQEEEEKEPIAVRNLSHWRGSQWNNKSQLLTRRNFEPLMKNPVELAFSVQKYVRCRGTNASLYRILWSKIPRKCYALNICNPLKFADATAAAAFSRKQSETLRRRRSSSSSSADDNLLLTSLSEELMKYFCVVNTSDPTHLRLPKVRGSPIAKGVEMVDRIVEHVALQFAGMIHFETMVADFIRDETGNWWFLRVVDFQAFTWIEMPAEILLESEDSVTQVADWKKKKYHMKYSKQATHATQISLSSIGLTSCCSLCGNATEMTEQLKQEVQEIVQRYEAPVEVTRRALSRYHLTFKMALDTVYRLRQRGLRLFSWEGALFQIKKASLQTSDLVVCFLCYQVYKAHQGLAIAALELNEIMHSCPLSRSFYAQQQQDFTTAGSPESSQDFKSCFLTSSSTSILKKVQAFYQEKTALGRLPDLPRHYTYVKGPEINATSAQLRFVFFFHELQDGGPDVNPEDFYLEYQFGQVLNRLDFEGSKQHTPNRWQLCETRLHYSFAPVSALFDYFYEKQILIKMKKVATKQCEGLTLLSLRSLISATKWQANSLCSQSRTEFLIEVQTASYGLLFLKVSVGFVVDAVPFRNVREILRDGDFLQEKPYEVYWPPQSFCVSDKVIPDEWLGSLLPSEYVIKQPWLAKKGKLSAYSSTGGAFGNKSGLNGQKQIAKQLQQLSEGLHPSLVASLRRRHSQNTEPRIENAVGMTEVTQNKPGKLALRQRKSSVFADKAKTGTRALLAPLKAAQLIMSRLSGTEEQFPIFLLGNLLRHANFVSKEGISSLVWGSPASFVLQNTLTVDDLLLEPLGTCVASVAVLAELLLVMLKSNCIPVSVSFAELEEYVAPFWLQQDANFHQLSGPNVKSLAHRRIIWNRAIRRCEAAHLNPSFQQLQPAMRCVVPVPHRTTAAEQVARMRRRMSYRAKSQALLLCDIFEDIEALDSGYIDVAELRSMHKFLPEDGELDALNLKLSEIPLQKTEQEEKATSEKFNFLSGLLERSRKISLRNVLETLVKSSVFQEVFTRFDTGESGEINFESFWNLAEHALDERDAAIAITGASVVAFTPGFCLRHGKCQAHQVDGICVACENAYNFQDIGRVELTSEHQETHRQTKEEESKSDDDYSEEYESDESSHAARASSRKTSVSNRKPTLQELKRQSRASSPARSPSQSTIAIPEKLSDEALDNVLLNLEAAELRMLGRRESTKSDLLRKKSFSSSQRSLNSNVRLVSTVSGSEKDQAAMDQRTEAEPFEACEKMDSAAKTEKNQPNAVKALKVKKKTSVSKNPKQSQEKMKQKLQVSPSLSSLLREELRGENRNKATGNNTLRTNDLIYQMERVERKKKQMDDLVLQELQQVKERLAHLLT